MRKDHPVVGEDEGPGKVVPRAGSDAALFRGLEKIPVHAGIRVAVHVEASEDRGSPDKTPRADVQWVVTEYGAVNLYGKSLPARARLLISIAHPDDREALDRAAFERFGPHWYNASF